MTSEKNEIQNYQPSRIFKRKKGFFFSHEIRDLANEKTEPNHVMVQLNGTSFQLRGNFGILW